MLKSVAALLLASGAGVFAEEEFVEKPLADVGWKISLLNRVYDSAASTTTWRYELDINADEKDLSHFVLGVPDCSAVVYVGSGLTGPTLFAPGGINFDPTTKLTGMKWDEGVESGTTTYYEVTVNGNVPSTSGSTVKYAVKGATYYAIGSVVGPDCALIQDLTCAASTGTAQCTRGTVRVPLYSAGSANYKTASWASGLAGSSVNGDSIEFSAATSCSTGAQQATLSLQGDGGASKTCSASFSFADLTPPSLSNAPGNVVVEVGDVPAVATVTASDSCDPAPAVTFTEVTEGNLVIRTWVATDACNNQATHHQTVTIQDTFAPAMMGVEASASVDCFAVPEPCEVIATDASSDNIIVNFQQKTVDGTCPHTYDLVRTWTAADATGNTNSASQTIHVQDFQKPTLVGVPGNLNVACGQIPTAPTVTAHDNCDPNVSLEFAQTKSTSTNDNDFTLLRTWTATDACGNSQQQTQTIVVRDTEAPTLSGVESDQTVSCGAVPPPCEVVAKDSCDTSVSVPTYSQVSNAGSCPNDYKLVRTWTSIDASGNQASEVQTITVVDTEKPELRGLPSSTEWNVSCDNVPSWNPTADDNCDSISVGFTSTRDDGSDASDHDYTLVHTWAVQDRCGNADSFSATIHVTDTTKPTLLNLPPAIIHANCASVPTAPAVTMTDNCCGGQTVHYTEARVNGSCSSAYTLLRSWSTEDCDGNAAAFTQTIHVSDSAKPTCINFPGDKTQLCDAVDLTLPVVTCSDTCDTAPALTKTSSTVDGDCAQEYKQVTLWHAVDSCGNFIDHTQTISVVDTAGPALTVAPTTLVSCEDADPAINPDVLDNCDTNPVVTSTSTQENGGCVFNYTTTTTFTATDACGNTGTATHRMIRYDVAPPVIAVDADGFATGATDLCDLAVVLKHTEETTQNGCAANYELTHTWNAVDSCGNAAAPKYKTVTVVTDGIPPVLSCTNCGQTNFECDDTPLAPDVKADDNSEVTCVPSTQNGSCSDKYSKTWDCSATDACGNTASFTHTRNFDDTTNPQLHGVPDDASYECGSPEPSLPLVTGSDNCDTVVTVTSDFTVNGASKTYTFTAVDNCGNTVQDTYTVTVEDTAAPQITCPANTANDCTAVSSPDPTFSDVCSGQPVLVASLVKDTATNMQCTNAGTIVHTWTVTDAAGLSASCKQTVTVTDDVDPWATSAPVNMSLSCDETVPAPPQVSFEDNCAINLAGEFSSVKAPQNDDDNYTIVRTWTATDNCSNSHSVSQTITVSDSQNPSLTVPANAEGQCSADLGTPTFDDDCSVPTLTQTDSTTPGTCARDFSTVRAYELTDATGHVATGSATMTVHDTQIPQFTSPSGGVDTLEWSADLVVAVATPGATDNCVDPTVTMGEGVKTDGKCAHDYSVLFTATANDGCNSNTWTRTVVVEDTVGPSFTVKPTDATFDCGQALPEPPASVTEDTLHNYEQLEIFTSTCQKVYTRTWTIKDECAHQDDHIQTLTVADTTAPELTVPADAERECSDVYVVPDATASDDCQTVTATKAFTSSGNLEFYTWTVQGGCGSAPVVGTQTVTIVDNTDPEISGPTGYTTSMNHVGENPMQCSSASASDNCGSPTVTCAEEREDGTCVNEWILIRTYTATDAFGNTAVHTQTITVEDNTAPVLSGLPATPLTVEQGNVPVKAQVTADDGEQGVIVVEYTETKILDTVDNDPVLYTLIRTWSATDHCQHTTTGSQTIIVVDTTAPIIIGVPDDEVRDCHIGLRDVSEITANIASQLETGVTLSGPVLVRTDGTCANEFTNTYTWTATDASGNSVSDSYVVEIVDNDAPTWKSFPADDQTQCTTTTPEATAADACEANGNAEGFVTVTVTEAFLPADKALPYIATRTYTATDKCGNTISKTQESSVLASNGAFFVAPLPSTTATQACVAPAAPQLSAGDACGNASVAGPVETTLTQACANRRTFTRTWTAKDSRGVAGATFTQTVTVTDATAPTFNLPLPAQNVNVECDIPAAPTMTGQDNCGGAVTVVAVPSDTTDGRVYTVTAKDVCGNEETFTQTIVVDDITPPVIADAPADKELACTDPEEAVVSLTVTDNCDADWTVDEDRVSADGSCTGASVITRTWTATDVDGNIADSKESTITISDSTAPTWDSLLAFATKSYEACGTMPAFEVPQASDDCSTATVTQTTVDATNTCDGHHIRTFSAADDCGNSIPGVQTITVRDTQNPTITVANDAQECDSKAPSFPSPEVSDCHTYTVAETAVQETGDACERTYQKTFTATDACGRTASATSTVVVSDSTDPEFDLASVPANNSEQCVGDVNLVDPTATDACDTAVTITKKPFVDVVIGYVTTRETTWEAKDDCGNTAEVTHTTTFEDTTNPVFDATPGDASVQCTVPAAPTLTGDDNCAGALTAAHTFVDSGSACDAVRVNTWTLTDTSGNSAEHVQTVTVKDTTKPTWKGSPGSDLSFDCTQGVIPQPEAEDNCGQGVAVTFSDSPATKGADDLVKFTRTFTATDSCGNFITHAITVSVVDDSAPTLTVNRLGRTDFICDDGADQRTAPTATFDDNCGATLGKTETVVVDGCVTTYTTVFTVVDGVGKSTSTTVVDKLTDDAGPVIAVADDATVECFQLEAPASASDKCDGVDVAVLKTITTTDGSCPTEKTVVYSYSAEDACGNKSTKTRTVIVEDTIAPELTVGSATGEKECGGSYQIPDGSANDNCDGSVAVSKTTVSTHDASHLCVFTETTTYSASDACGNTATASHVVTVTDSTAPAWTTSPLPAATVSFQCEADTPATLSASDDCNSATVTFVDGSIRTWTATDECGNQITHEQTVTVKDDTPPTLTVDRVSETVECDAVPVLYDGIAHAQDNCDEDPVVSCSETRANGSCSQTYTLSRKCVALDASGNTAEATHTVSVQDTTKPELMDVPTENVQAEFCQDVALPDVSARDNCDAGMLAVSFTETKINESCAHEYDLQRVYEASDSCGNVATASYTVLVRDSVPAELSQYPQDASVECDSIPEKCTVSALPACDGSADGTVVYAEVKGNANGQGAYTIVRTWTNTDVCGRNRSHSQTITVADTSAPLLSRKPADVVVGCDCDTFPGTVDVVALDNCDQNVDVVLVETRENGASAGLHNYKLFRTWTATDAAGNKVSHVQTITVEDKEAPALALVIDAAVQVSCDNVPTLRDYQPFVRDNCDDNPTVSHAQVTTAGGCSEEYQVVHTWTMSDDSGNTQSFTQAMQVADDTAPRFVGDGAKCVKGLENGKKAVFQDFVAGLKAFTNDNCAEKADVQFSPTVTCNSTDTSNHDDCTFANGSINVYSRDYSTDVATFTVYATAQDPCGNVATIKQQILVPRAGAYAFAGVDEATCVDPNQ